MQIISATCEEAFTPCFGEGVTMVDFQLCGHPDSTCYDAVDACGLCVDVWAATPWLTNCDSDADTVDVLVLPALAGGSGDDADGADGAVLVVCGCCANLGLFLNSCDCSARTAVNPCLPTAAPPATLLPLPLLLLLLPLPLPVVEVFVAAVVDGLMPFARTITAAAFAVCARSFDSRTGDAADALCVGDALCIGDALCCTRPSGDLACTRAARPAGAGEAPLWLLRWGSLHQTTQQCASE